MIKTFSILIPAYNAEPFIDKCLKSISRQIFKDFEVIIIDDGSTDKTFEICRQFVKKDSRFSIYHQHNSGIAVTRNKLLDMAKGEWIAFIDADDYVKEDYLDNFHKNISIKGTEVVVCNYKIKNTQGNTKEYYQPFYSKEEYLLKLLSWQKINTALWAKVIKNSFVKRHCIRFEENITLGEDLCFMARLFYYAENITYVPTCSYVWNRTNVNSMTKSPISINKYINNYLPLYERIFVFYNTKPDYKIYERTLNNTLVKVLEFIYLYSKHVAYGNIPLLINEKELSILNKWIYFLIRKDLYIMVKLTEKTFSIMKKIFRLC